MGRPRKTKEEKDSVRRKSQRNYYWVNINEAREKGRLHASKPEQKEKAWKYRLKKQYNLTVEGYNHLLKIQNSRCAICFTDDPGRGDINWPVDHCHKTGKIRGLLCHRCNRTLGNINDDITIVKNILNYLT